MLMYTVISKVVRWTLQVKRSKYICATAGAVHFGASVVAAQPFKRMNKSRKQHNIFEVDHIKDLILTIMHAILEVLFLIFPESVAKKAWLY